MVQTVKNFSGNLFLESTKVHSTCIAVDQYFQCYNLITLEKSQKRKEKLF